MLAVAAAAAAFAAAVVAVTAAAASAIAVAVDCGLGCSGCLTSLILPRQVLIGLPRPLWRRCLLWPHLLRTLLLQPLL
jgi:hypothetical protein